MKTNDILAVFFYVYTQREFSKPNTFDLSFLKFLYSCRGQLNRNKFELIHLNKYMKAKENC